MLVNWKKDRILVIPILSGNIQRSSINLLPGINEVPDEDWEAVRSLIDDKLQLRHIEEVHAEVKEEIVEKKDKEGKVVSKEKKTKIKAKKFKDLAGKEAVKLIKDTYDIKQLEKWLDESGTESVRADIHKQLKRIDEYGEKKLKERDEKGSGEN